MSLRLFEARQYRWFGFNWLQDLACLIPNLAPANRLSKSLIVKESIDYLRTQRGVRLAAATEVRQLLADYDALRVEINNWRSLYHPGGVQEVQARPVNNALQDLLEVDQEVFGKFPGGFGDNGTGDEHDEDHGDIAHNGWRECDTNIEIPNANPSALFPESDAVALCDPIEGNSSFDPSVLTSKNTVPSENSHTNITYALPSEEEGYAGHIPWNYDMPTLDDIFVVSLGGQNGFQSQTSPSSPVFSTAEAGQSLYRDMPSRSYEQNTPKTQYPNSQYQSYNTESHETFHSAATNQLSTGYVSMSNYNIGNTII